MTKYGLLWLVLATNDRLWLYYFMKPVIAIYVKFLPYMKIYDPNP